MGQRDDVVILKLLPVFASLAPAGRASVAPDQLLHEPGIVGVQVNAAPVGGEEAVPSLVVPTQAGAHPAVVLRAIAGLLVRFAALAAGD